ncbi:MAG: hypothetical protein M0Z82_07060, partial [Actinomycetota bacterium]|nr:hypothetical protein [Actinomycetota bacterium]
MTPDTTPPTTGTLPAAWDSVLVTEDETPPPELSEDELPVAPDRPEVAPPTTLDTPCTAVPTACVTVPTALDTTAPTTGTLLVVFCKVLDACCKVLVTGSSTPHAEQDAEPACEEPLVDVPDDVGSELTGAGPGEPDAVAVVVPAGVGTTT